MSSPLVAVLYTALVVLCLGGAVHCDSEDQPQILDSVKVVIVSKQDDDGKWVNEVKLEHGTDLAPWKVEVEQKTLARGGRKTVELTATLTGPKPSPLTNSVPYGHAAPPFIAGLRAYPGSTDTLNQERDQIPGRPENFWFPNRGQQIAEPDRPGRYPSGDVQFTKRVLHTVPYGSQIPGGLENFNRGQHIGNPDRPGIYSPGGIMFPNREHNVGEASGPQILGGLENINRGQHIGNPDRPGIYPPGGIPFPNREHNVGEHSGPQILGALENFNRGQQISNPDRPGVYPPGGILNPNYRLPTGQATTRPRRTLYETTWQGSHYLLFDERTDWKSATKWCADAGSQLAIINSEEEAALLVDILRRFWMADRGAFVGITDEDQEGNWVTLDGVPIDASGFSRWFKDDQPDNQNGNENCGSVVSENGGLNDVPCTNYLLYTICEKKTETVQIKELLDAIFSKDGDNNGIEDSGSASAEDYDVENGEGHEQQEGASLGTSERYLQTDENGWDNLEVYPEQKEDEKTEREEDKEPKSGYMKYKSSSSLYKVQTKQMDWQTANKTCVKEGAHLAVINSEDEAMMLASLLNLFYEDSYRGAFVGLTDEAEEGTWLTIFGQTTSEAGYGRWFIDGQRDKERENYDCGAIYPEKGCLIVVSCTDLMHSICEKDGETETESVIIR